MSRSPLLFLLAALAGASLGCQRAPRGPSILLITLDTTRRDHLGAYGYAPPTSPSLDRLARDSVVYTRAYATSSWTLPTHASIFTGKLPTAHGANYDPEGPLKLSDGIEGGFDRYRARPIAADEVTLAQVLTEHGYATGGIIAGPWMKRRFQLDRGFEHYDDEGVTALNGRPAADVTRAAIEFVDAHASEPYFLFLNYYDAHGPWYQQPADADGRPTGMPVPLQDTRGLLPPGVDPARMDGMTFQRLCYDAEIRYMDAEIGRLLEHLRAKGLYEDTWIFVLADHGELIGDPVLGETGLYGHGDSLTEAEIHIPFLVKEPGAAGRKGSDASPVQQTDVLPTILARLGIALPPHVQGTVLGGRHPMVAELVKLPMMNRPESKDWRHLGDWRVLLDGSDKFGWSSNGTHFLVDLEKDPLERTNTLTERPEVAARLQGLLDTVIRLLPHPGATGEVEQPTPQEIRDLESLGYLGGGSHAPK